MMMKDTKKAVAIMGGMGPDASVRLYQRMIELAREEFGATHNQDYPKIVLHSLPVPDFITKKTGSAVAENMLKEAVSHLPQDNICCIGMACNTAHLLLPALRRLTSVTFMSLPELVGMEVNKRGIETVGLLASPTTHKCGLYKNVFMKLNIALTEPDQSQITILGKLITNVVAHNTTSAEAEIIKISEALIEKGAQALVLGCTELSLVFPKSLKFPVIDSVEVLSRALLSKYYSQEGD